MLKAVREAKEHTSWANTNADYESALTDFVRTVLDRSHQNRFTVDFEEFVRRTARIGLFNSLSQTLLKLTSPGVPDIYQGNELLEFSLVDPDNRRPVDYPLRRRLLAELSDLPLGAIVARLEELGLRPLSGSAADFGKLIVEHTEKWAKVVRFAGMRAD